jgi:hypothetical protein
VRVPPTRSGEEASAQDRAGGLAGVDRRRAAGEPSPRLIHSDGCRVLNRVGKGEYAYPRYLFSNRSEDIRRIFREACDSVGVRPTNPKPDEISIARRWTSSRSIPLAARRHERLDLGRAGMAKSGNRASLKHSWAPALEGSNPSPGTQTTCPSRTRSPRSNRSRPKLEMSTVVAAPPTISSASSLPTTGACWKPWPLKPFAR